MSYKRNIDELSYKFPFSKKIYHSCAYAMIAEIIIFCNHKL